MSIVKQIAILVVLVGLTGAGYYGYQEFYGGGISNGFSKHSSRSKSKRSRGRRAHRVVVSPVKQQPIRESIEAVGTTRSIKAIEVVALTSGRVIELTARPGQEVQKGDPIIKLDDDIEKANLAEARAKLQKAKSFLERSRTLRARKHTSQASLEQLQAEAAGAAAEVGRAERRLADRVVRAAFAGRVGLNKVEIGALVDNKTVLTTLDDISKVEIEFQLPEGVFGRLKRGMKVVAEAVAFPGRKFTGVVAHVDTRVDRVTRTFLVRARLPNSDRSLPAGMFMRLTLIFNERLAQVVPEEAVIAEGDSNFVFVVKDGRARKQTIKVGQRQPGLVELRAGVAIGDDVVVLGLGRLRDGKRVRVLGKGDSDEGRRKRGGRKGRGGEVRGVVKAIHDGGRRVVWQRQSDGQEVLVNVVSGKTRLTIDGKVAPANLLKSGMQCRIALRRSKPDARSISCKAKSGA